MIISTVLSKLNQLSIPTSVCHWELSSRLLRLHHTASSLTLLSVSRHVTTLDEADQCGVVCKLQELDRGVFRCADVRVEREEQRGENTALRSSSAGCVFSQPHYNTIQIKLGWQLRDTIHVHNYTEYNEEWNVFSAFNPSKCTLGAVASRLCSARGAVVDFLPEPGFDDRQNSKNTIYNIDNYVCT